MLTSLPHCALDPQSTNKNTEIRSYRFFTLCLRISVLKFLTFNLRKSIASIDRILLDITELSPVALGVSLIRYLVGNQQGTFLHESLTETVFLDLTRRAATHNHRVQAIAVVERIRADLLHAGGNLDGNDRGTSVEGIRAYRLNRVGEFDISYCTTVLESLRRYLTDSTGDIDDTQVRASLEHTAAHRLH